MREVWLGVWMLARWIGEKRSFFSFLLQDEQREGGHTEQRLAASWHTVLSDMKATWRNATSREPEVLSPYRGEQPGMCENKMSASWTGWCVKAKHFHKAPTYITVCWGTYQQTNKKTKQSECSLQVSRETINAAYIHTRVSGDLSGQH